MGVDSGDESTLRNELNADVAVEVSPFNKFVSIKGRSETYVQITYGRRHTLRDMRS